nr:MAG TPA: hypothetical protein [Caudoviricetes sp.]
MLIIPNHQYLILPLYTNNRHNTIRTFVRTQHS